MFTGLIQEVGTVQKAERQGQDLRLTLQAPLLSPKVKLGDSVAVNGCCLTVVEIKIPLLAFQAVPETLNRTALGTVKEGARVNLELPLTLSDHLGGHFVQGHVDGVAEITAINPEGQGIRMAVKVPKDLSRYIVEKGSIALNGISLTVAALKGDELEVALIPHTLQNTDLGSKRVGDPLHVEVDLLAKYVEKLSAGYRGAQS
ncbi:MAG TPA: riboflavin synthase [bacterium]|jgi:riboflavin synthase|nr:riboflavin synthase [bacterium]